MLIMLSPIFQLIEARTELDKLMIFNKDLSIPKEFYQKKHLCLLMNKKLKKYWVNYLLVDDPTIKEKAK